MKSTGLTFPDERIGVLLSRPANSDAGWHPFSDASGVVVLPYGHEFELRVDATASFDHSLLRQFKADALYSLQWVSTDEVTDASVDHLSHLTGLRGLALWETKIGDPALRYIKRLRNLRWLDIGDTQVTDAGLLQLQHLGSLREIGLLGTQIGDRGVEYLKLLPNLEKLDLMKTRVTDSGTGALAGMPALKYVRIVGTQISESGYSALKRLAPHCRIKFSATPLPGPVEKQRPSDSHE